ncbi:MAG: hypothetical protein ACLTWO_15245 [Blautia massiliensis (ex Durand et al. 2017)]|uniref:Uncharacterized protein n=1 Tax=Candidatus Gemmiger excrementigallinarum TaxID=2838609 RepID=A0A9D2J9W7_9FIRM|nr:hypothetical protein [Candidatus Gemmiger excrementigallinarum]
MMESFFKAAWTCVLLAVGCVYVCRLLFALLSRITHGEVSKDNGLWCAVTVISVLSFLVWAGGGEGWTDFSEYVSLTGKIFFFCVVCTLIKGILDQREGYRGFDGCIAHFLRITDNWKRFIEKAGRVVAAHDSAICAASLGLVFGTAVLSVCFQESRVFLYMLALILAYGMYLGCSLHSSQRLVALFLLMAFVLNAQAAALSKEPDQAKAMLMLAVLWGEAIVLWSAAILAADEAPAQLTLLCTNTIMTLTALAGIALAPMMRGQESHQAMTFLYGVVLPLLAAGYAARLGKSIYVYLKIHAPEKVCEAEKAP